MGGAVIEKRPVGKTGVELTRIGFGGAPIGDIRKAPSDTETRKLLETAWAAGIRYFDVAPMYGAGLAERRMGDFLRDKPRDDYVLSTKVGRLLVPDRAHAMERYGDARAMPFRYEFDFTYDGIIRSFEHSIQRLGLERIDILYLHDLGRFSQGTRFDETLTQALDGGGIRAITELRDSGAVKAIGDVADCRASDTTSSAGAPFRTKAEAPASSAAKTCSSPSYMVSTTSPTDGRRSRRVRTKSMPLPSPRLMSTTATSGSWARSRARASDRLAASATTVRSSVCSKARRSPCRMSAWSSTSSTLMGTVPPFEHDFDPDTRSRA